MHNQESIRLGSLIKTHGIHGELILEAHYPELIENIKESVLLQIEGLLVPFFIKEIVPASKERFRVSFDWIESETQAKKLVNTQVFIPSSHVNLSEDNFHDTPEFLVGFRLVDKNKGFIGLVTFFIDNPSNPLLEVEGENGAVLIPFHPHFITAINQAKKEIHVDLPEGLIDLN